MKGQLFDTKSATSLEFMFSSPSSHEEIVHKLSKIGTSLGSVSWDSVTMVVKDLEHSIN